MSTDWIPTSHSTICSKHFSPELIYPSKNGKRACLKKSAVPTLQLPFYVTQNFDANNVKGDPLSDPEQDVNNLESRPLTPQDASTELSTSIGSDDTTENQNFVACDVKRDPFSDTESNDVDKLEPSPPAAHVAPTEVATGVGGDDAMIEKILKYQIRRLEYRDKCSKQKIKRLQYKVRVQNKKIANLEGLVRALRSKLDSIEEENNVVRDVDVASARTAKKKPAQTKRRKNQTEPK